MNMLLHTVGDVTIVDPNEKFIRDPEQIRQFADELSKLVLQEGPRRIILDFGKVQLFSSSALGAMMNFKKQIDEKKSRMVVCCLSKGLKEVFKLVGLDRMFEVYPDQQKALAAFGVAPPQ
jgi:anti-sigma B factor antagonist